MEVDPVRQRRANVLGGGVALAVFVASLVALTVARGRGFLAGFVSFDRQAWLLVAVALFLGFGLGALVQARIALGATKK